MMTTTRRAIRTAAAASLLLAPAFLFAAGTAFGDARDDEIFGESTGEAPGKPGSAESAKAPGAKTPGAEQGINRGADDRPTTMRAGKPVDVKAIAETTQIGGRLEGRVQAGGQERTSPAKAAVDALTQADVYFDSRPNKDIRAFLRLRLWEESTGNPFLAQESSTSSAFGGGARSACATCVNTAFDEAWFKWDIGDTLYLTAGKQHLKWGSGHFWNPTDFTADVVLNPFDLFDRRLGRQMIKINLPFESGGHNLYAIVQYDNARTLDDIGGALRAELSFAGQGEAAFTVQTRPGRPIRLGADVSTALGPFDLHAEAAFTTRDARTLYSGGVDPAKGTLPGERVDTRRWTTQVATGADDTIKLAENVNLTLGAEYFYNQFGYDDRLLELYALSMGQSQFLYAGRQYVGAFASLPTPGSLTHTSFFLNGLMNLSDQSATLQATTSYVLFNEATLELFASRCFGDYGEFCFRVPQSLRGMATLPTVPSSLRGVLAALPARRTLLTAGAGLSTNF